MTEITLDQKIEWVQKMYDSRHTEMMHALHLGYADAHDDLHDKVETIFSILADCRKQQIPDSSIPKGVKIWHG